MKDEIDFNSFRKGLTKKSVYLSIAESERVFAIVTFPNQDPKMNNEESKRKREELKMLIYGDL